MNVVADAIGRGQTVLVVCRKQAALKVVQKRLDAEGLGDRLFIVVDVNRDREAIIRSIREQLDKIRAAAPGRIAVLRRQREEKADRIEALEAEIDKHHTALHDVDDLTGFTYRDLLGALVGLEAQGSYIAAPGLRPRLTASDHGRVSVIEEICGPLARLWLEAAYENSPLAVLRRFAVDASVVEALNADLAAFVAAEAGRDEVLASSTVSFDVDDPAPYAAWLDAHRGHFEGLPNNIRQGLGAWLDLFKPSAASAPTGVETIQALEKVRGAIETIPSGLHDDTLFEPLSKLSTADLQLRFGDARKTTEPASFMGRLNPIRWARRRRVRAYLSELGDTADDGRIASLRDALDIEQRLRPLRTAVVKVLEILGLAGHEGPLTIKQLKHDVEALITELRSVEAAAAAILSCPRREEAEAAARVATRDAFDGLRRGFEGAFDRHAARQRSRAALRPLEAWFTEEWIAASRLRIERAVRYPGASGSRKGASHAGCLSAVSSTSR